MDHDKLTDEMREVLLSLTGTSVKRMFGADAYFVGPAMFAFFAPGAIVLRLPHAVFAEAVASKRAIPFLSLGAAHLNGWAEVPFERCPLDDLRALVESAHASGTRVARAASRRRKPSGARRTRRRRPQTI
jgi:hypothetical protein